MNRHPRPEPIALTEAQRITIVYLHETYKLTLRAIGKRFGCSGAYIRQVLNEERRKSNPMVRIGAAARKKGLPAIITERDIT